MIINVYAVFRLENGEIIVFRNTKNPDSNRLANCYSCYYDTDNERHELGYQTYSIFNDAAVSSNVGALCAALGYPLSRCYVPYDTVLLKVKGTNYFLMAKQEACIAYYDGTRDAVCMPELIGSEDIGSLKGVLKAMVKLLCTISKTDNWKAHHLM